MNTTGVLLLVCGPDLQYKTPSREYLMSEVEVENEVMLMLFERNPSNTDM